MLTLQNELLPDLNEYKACNSASETEKFVLQYSRAYVRSSEYVALLPRTCNLACHLLEAPLMSSLRTYMRRCK